MLVDFSHIEKEYLNYLDPGIVLYKRDPINDKFQPGLITSYLLVKCFSRFSRLI